MNAETKQAIKTIMLVLPDLKAGGAQRMFINLANFFAKSGYNTHLTLLTRAQSDFSGLSDQVILHNLQAKRAVNSLMPLANLIKTVQPGLIISALTYVNILTILARLLSGVRQTRLIITERAYHSINAKMTVKFYQIEKMLMRAFYPLADKVVGISKGVTEDIRCVAGLSAYKTETIYNPVVTSALDERLNAPLPITLPTGKIIMSCGRLVPVKDFPTLLRAFAILHETQPEAHLLLLGDGPLKDELVALAHTFHIQNHVHFSGFVENPMPVFKAADLFVLTSKSEGFGNVIVEALYAGTPVVSTDCPTGPGEILKGLPDSLAPVGDAQAIAQLMALKLKQGKSAYDYKARACDFHVETIGQQFLDLAMSLQS